MFLHYLRRLNCIPCLLTLHQSGSEPNVVIWDLSSSTIISELSGAHKFGVELVKFSPDGRYLVSIGFEHDQSLTVWDLFLINKVPNATIAKAAITGKTHSVSFAPDSSFFATAGARQLRFWSLAPLLQAPSATKLGVFSGVIAPPTPASGNSPTTQNASTKRSIEDPIEEAPHDTASTRPVSLEGRAAIARNYRDASFTDVAVSPSDPSVVYVVTDTGHLVVFNASSRVVDKFIDLRVSKISSVSVCNSIVVCGCASGAVRLFDSVTLDFIASAPLPEGPASLASDKNHPGVVCTRLYSLEGKTSIFCLYSNRSVFVWDATEANSITKYRSFQAHSGCIWSIDSINGRGTRLPAGTFVTASADSTLRFWNFDSEMPRTLDCININSVDDQSCGIRCVRVSPDGQQVASGDRTGTLRVHDISGASARLVMQEDAHDDEILAISFAQKEDGLILASGGRDRCVHVFGSISTDETTVYALRTSLEEHSSSVTAICFATGSNGKAVMASAGSDKALLIRESVDSDADWSSFSRAKRAAAQGAIYDICFDSSSNYILAVGQEKKVAIYDAATGRMVRALKLDSNAGPQVCLELDPSGQFVATVGQDRVIRVFNLQSGELVSSQLSGHAELVTGCKFSCDGSKFVSTGADGCLFVWKLPTRLSSQIQSRLATMPPRFSSPKTQAKNDKRGKPLEAQTTAAASDARIAALLNGSALPAWAKSAVRQQSPATVAWCLVDSTSEEPQRQVLLGKWATRASEGYKLCGNSVASSDRSSLRSILPKKRTSLSPSEDVPLFFQTEKSSTKAAEKSDAAEELDDFVDPAQLENMWSAFKEEPLERLMKPGMFDTLIGDAARPKPSNPSRLSLSSRFRTNHKSPAISMISEAAVTPAAQPTATEANSAPVLPAAQPQVVTAAPVPESTKARDRKELIAEEVERTRKRLMEMGMLSGSKRTAPKPVASPAPLRQEHPVAESKQIVALHLDPEPQKENKTECVLAQEPPVEVAVSTTEELPTASESLEPEEPAEEQAESTDDLQSEFQEAVLPSEVPEAADSEFDSIVPTDPAEPAGETQEFLTNLSHAFHRTVELYQELKQQNRQDDVVCQIANFFNQIQSKLHTVLGTSSSDEQTRLLEKYSDLLTAMVATKLQRK